MNDQQLGTVVIGGSQAGLAVGYYLKQRGLPFVILDENDRIGDAWRKRWDSLHLFTPGRYNGLPGMPFPGSPWAYPTKDETADYLEAFARAFELPVRTGVKFDRLAKTRDRFEVPCGQHTLFGSSWRAPLASLISASTAVSRSAQASEPGPWKASVSGEHPPGSFWARGSSPAGSHVI